MDIFVLFTVFLSLLFGLAEFITGFYIWRNFKENFEIRTIGGIFVLRSPLSWLMALRILFWDLGWISENMAFYLFFIEYLLAIPPFFLFTLPRFSYLVFKSSIAKKIAWVLSSILSLIYLIMHFNLREEIIAYYSPVGLLFESPPEEKMFLAVSSIFLFPLMVQRLVYHFLQWRKTRAFPYRFINYLLLFFILLMGVFVVSPFPLQFQPWRNLLWQILALTGILSLYFITSQEFITKEVLISISEEKERLSTQELKKEIERLKKETLRLERELIERMKD